MGWPRRKSKQPKAPAQEAQSSSRSQDDQPKPAKTPMAQPSRENKPEVAPPAEQPARSLQPTPANGLASTVSAGAPFGLDASANEEIARVWQQVQEKVSQLAQSEGENVNGGLEIADVIENLEHSQEKEEESQAAKTVKTVFGRTLGLIKTVGGIVADGASTVFAPAGQCYNAITFLINAYDGYQGAFEGLAELLEKCCDHLGRLDYYVKGGMDKRLTGVAAQQLLLFVNICDAAMKLRHSAGEKIKTGLKIAFLQEDSIQELLTDMAKLADRERGLVSAQTFQFASEAAKNAAQAAAFGEKVLATLAQNNADQQERAEKESQERSLADVLAFETSPGQSWQIRFNDIRKHVVPDTGRWLLDHAAFQSWTTNFESSPILGVEGTEFTGKSYLTSSVIRYLQKEMATKWPSLRHLVSFFFVEQGDSGQGFDVAAKSLIWQLSSKDVPYMKSASRISQTVKTLDPNEIIPKLLLENTEIQHMDAVFYLIIDGLGDIVDDALIKFLQRASEPSEKRIRIFLTGLPAAFAQIRKGGVNYRNIPINENNADDIEKFLENRMDKLDALSDIRRPGVTERRSQIREGLSEATKGNYYKMNSALNAISTLDYMEDIMKVIRGAHEDLAQQLYHELETLNRERTPRQIQEINQIILWVTFALSPVSEEHISAILYMNIGEAPLQSLAERFRTKYLLFTIGNRRHVGFRSSKALEAIPHRRVLKGSSLRNDQEVHPAEINMVKQFLDKVCPPDVYKKLDFDKYLEQKLHQKQDQIHQEDNDTGHLLLALDCLRVLCRIRDASIAALQDYALENLIKHLSLVDLSMVDREQKSQVGELLVMAFTQNEYIDNFMWKQWGHGRLPRRCFWLNDGQNSDQVIRWLKDTAVVSNISDHSDRSWVKEVVSGNGFEALFRPAVLRLAYICFKEPKRPLNHWEANDIYEFIHEFLSKTHEGTTSGIYTLSEMESLVRFENWAYEALQSANKDTLWHTQMGMIYEKTSLKEQSLDRYDLALQLDSTNWRAALGWARVAEPNEAIEKLKEVIRGLESDMQWMQDPSHMEDLANVTFELAEVYLKAGSFDLASLAYSASIKQDPRRTDHLAAILYTYRRYQKWSTMVSFIEELGAISNKKHLLEMLHSEDVSHTLHYGIGVACSKTAQLSIVNDVYPASIELAERRQDHAALLRLRFGYARALSIQPSPGEDKIIRLMELALKQDFPASGLPFTPTVVSSDFFADLACRYLDRALLSRANKDLETAMSYLHKISDILPSELTSAQVLFPPQLFLARYYHIDGDHEQAQNAVKTLIQIALELLSDDDEENDEGAFGRLLLVFRPLEDTKNATTALLFMAQNYLVPKSDLPEYLKTYYCSGDHEGDKVRIPMNFSCSGQCDHVWKVPSEIWYCTICPDVALEENCFGKLKAGDRLEGNICHPDHQFVKIPKWDQDRMASLPEGTAPWGDRNITLDEWKQEIRNQYLSSKVPKG